MEIKNHEIRTFIVFMELFGRLLTGIAGSNPVRGTDVRLFKRMPSVVRGLCVGLITRPEESYRVWSV